MEPNNKSTTNRRHSSGQQKSKLSKERLAEALKKKKECAAKAQKIVEKLMESSCSDKEFISKLSDINQSHYDDIVEERSIISLCGYPLCKETLSNIPKKQYQISTICNKVYDITERKKFCSNSCYRASEYIKEQMMTSPLWLRDQEAVPEFKLLTLNENVPQ